MNVKTINYNNSPMTNRNLGKPMDIAPNKYLSNPSPDPFERGAGIQDRSAPEKMTKPVYQKNARHVHLEPLMGGSPQSLGGAKKEMQTPKPTTIDNISTLGRKGKLIYSKRFVRITILS